MPRNEALDKVMESWGRETLPWDVLDEGMRRYWARRIISMDPQVVADIVRKAMQQGEADSDTDDR